MNKKLFTLIAVLLSSVFLLNAQTSLRKSPVSSPLQKLSQGFALGEIKIEYSRPSVKGRVIFGELVPYDEIWRTGANAATTIEFTQDIKFGNTPIKPGVYALYTIPGKEEWEVMLYRDLSLGGNTGSYDKADEVARLKVNVEENQSKVETFTIAINNITNSSCSLDLAWDKTIVRIPIKTEEKK
ncbi:MAG: DUF2911 domain-containing protein [Bacteroidia bacterium]|nr:DUF2911 domain-containing protein [Bacteroidia bacterium]MCZ2276650.1 DUF2911 domain-containing protein [Bacteroidia bacterium]